MSVKCIPHLTPFSYSETGYTVVYLFFLLLLKNIDCGYKLEPPWSGGSHEYPQSMFWSNNTKNFDDNFQFFQL